MRKPDRREAREAAKDGAKLTVNSGRNYEKGDAKLGPFLIDYKHNAKSFVLALANWAKHSRDAWKEGHREPIISVIFEDETKVAIVDWQLFKDMADKYYGGIND